MVAWDTSFLDSFIHSTVKFVYFQELLLLDALSKEDLRLLGTSLINQFPGNRGSFNKAALGAMSIGVWGFPLYHLRLGLREVL